jgi:hypothetical protein
MAWRAFVDPTYINNADHPRIPYWCLCSSCLASYFALGVPAFGAPGPSLVDGACVALTVLAPTQATYAPVPMKHSSDR